MIKRIYFLGTFLPILPTLEPFWLGHFDWGHVDLYSLHKAHYLYSQISFILSKSVNADLLAVHYFFYELDTHGNNPKYIRMTCISISHLFISRLNSISNMII